MSLARVGVIFVAMYAIVPACAYQEQDDDLSSVTSEMRGGCHTVCPRCRPGEICPMMACFIECNGPGERCGSHFCPQGQVCCNESCGICTEPFGACTMEYCMPIGPRCQSDADCYLFSDYCTGCDCRALRTTDLVPTCDGPGVRCLVDPCMGKSATCDLKTGTCVAL